MLKAVNEAFSFFVELAMLAAFCYAGFHWGNTPLMRYVLGLGMPAVLIFFWAKKMAPKAPHRFGAPLLWIVSLLLFEGAALALFLSGATRWSFVLALAALVNTALKFFFGEKTD